jgi:hypothetical protein
MFNPLEVERNFPLFENLIDYILYLIEKDENADKNIIDYDTFIKNKELIKQLITNH